MMAECYFTVEIGGNRKLCLAPLSERRLAASGQVLADTGGYFLFEQRGAGENADVEILAQVLSDDAAFRLRQMLGMR